VEFFQILLVESIPKMLGLKRLELELDRRFDQQFFDMVGQCIRLHQGEIEELRLVLNFSSVGSSIVGLAPALRRLKVIWFDGVAALTLLELGGVSGILADCDALEEFGYTQFFQWSRGMSTDEFKSICQLLFKFPSLMRVSQHGHQVHVVNLREESRFTAFLEMVKTSKTIEQVSTIRCGNAKEAAAIKQHCHNNKMHNRFKLIREKASSLPTYLVAHGR
jgi:hypothetical protein